MKSPRSFVCIAGLVLSVVVALPPALAQPAFTDLDGDGVADAVDACPDTEPADLVGPDGCAPCACEDPAWSSKGDYLGCVRTWIKAGRSAGSIDAPTARTLLRQARNSTCGNPALVRCCVYQTFDTHAGKCRIMTEASCDALDDRLFDTDGAADVEDAGSCLPNPCQF